MLTLIPLQDTIILSSIIYNRQSTIDNRQSKTNKLQWTIEKMMIQKGKANTNVQFPFQTQMFKVFLLLQCLLLHSVHAAIHKNAQDEGILINFDIDVTNLIPGNGICLNRLIAAQEENSNLLGKDLYFERALQVEEEEDTTIQVPQEDTTAEEDEKEEVNDDAVMQILFNENFAKCNDETKLFYRENPHIEAVVRKFGDSASVFWDGPNEVNLKLEFNRTMKDIMKETCLNKGNLPSNSTSRGEGGKYAFAGDLNCTYKLEGGATANTTIVNYANCVANTTACQKVDDTEFLQIVMHSFGSACSGFQRERTLFLLLDSIGFDSFQKY